MFSKELENLIEACLADGILEDNEKAALVKRAQKEGVDVDELEIYINSIMQKRRQTKTAEEDAREEARNEKKKKEIGKVCPHCGAPIPPLAESCPSCGTVILTATVNEKIEKKIDEVRIAFSKASGIAPTTADKKKEALGNLAQAKALLLELKMYYGSVQKVQVFASQMDNDCLELENSIKNTSTRLTKIIKAGVIYYIIGAIISLIALCFLPQLMK